MESEETQIREELDALRQLVLELSRTVEQQGAMLGQFTQILEQYSELLKRLAIVVAQDHPEITGDGSTDGAES